MLANSDTGDEQFARVRIGLGEIAQHELSVIADDVVGHEWKWRNDPAAAEREITRQHDADMNLHHLREPGVAAVFRGFALKPGRMRHGRARCLESALNMFSLCRLVAAKTNRGVQWVLEYVHPQTAVARMVVERVEQNHELRHGAGAVVALHGGGERRQVGVGHHRIRAFVELSGRPAPPVKSCVHST